MTTPPTQRTVEEIAREIVCGQNMMVNIQQTITAERTIAEGLRNKLSLCVEGLEKYFDVESLTPYGYCGIQRKLNADERERLLEELLKKIRGGG
jgi:hypothetical protein